MDTELRRREAEAYAASYADGLVDLYLGLSIAWIGVAWLWIDSLAALAGVFPAILVAPFVALRRQLLERRMGYVKWSVPRRRWERRQLSRLLWLGVGAFVAGVAAFAFAADRLDGGSFIAGLPAILLAVPLLLLGFASGLKRALVYGAVLLVGGITVGLVESDPGPGLLAGGAVTLVTGAVMWARFTAANPVRDA